MLSNISNTTCWRDYLSQRIFLPPLSKINWPWVSGFISGLSNLFYWSICLLLCQFHAEEGHFIIIKSQFIKNRTPKYEKQELQNMRGDDREWDGWMASLTQWTWVWATSGRWWRTGKPGVLQPMGLQRVRHDWVMNNNDKEDRDTLTIRMGNVNTHSHLGEFSPIMERIDTRATKK